MHAHATQEEMLAAIRKEVRDQRVLDAFRRVRRDLFVPEELHAFAWENRPLPIGEGQTISQPQIVAAMTDALELRPEDRVLEIGTGSGYQTALLAALAAEVVSVERHAALTGTAARNLARAVSPTPAWRPRRRIRSGFLAPDRTTQSSSPRQRRRFRRRCSISWQTVGGWSFRSARARSNC